MKKILIVLCIGLVVISCADISQAQKSSTDLLKEGLLGAGAGAVGGAASGAKGRDVWKGALAGAGVNIVGGALLDSMSGEKVRSAAEPVHQMPAQDAYSTGYQDGFNNGYKAGYTQGYKDGIKEAVTAR